MRLPTDVRTRFLALGLTALLAGCSVFRGGDGMQVASADAAVADARTGPAADYPVVVGEPYEIAGKLHTPRDTMNFDEVGYAVADPQGGAGVTVAHRTLPMPSYIEITALDTGKTILARVERRGPMTGNGAVALSAGAQAQLEVAEGAPIRVRRVNPIEADRAKLRMGEVAPLRMKTPKSLLTVLKRKLSNDGAVSLAAAKPSAPAPKSNAAPSTGNELPPVRRAANTVTPTPTPTRVVERPAPVAAAPATRQSFDNAFAQERKAVTAYPLAPLNGARSAAPARRVATAAPAPVVVDKAPEPANRISATPTPVQRQAAPTPSAQRGNYVIQAAAFSSKANAERAANSIGGFVQRSGKFYRVRTGPFVNRGQAEAALAKVRAAGYRDARVFTAG